jgi:signal peptidase I
MAAFLLSILSPGAGHVALGYPKTGLKWFIGVAMTFVLLVTAIIAGQRYLAWLFAAIAIVIRLANIADTLRPRILPKALGKLKITTMVLLMLVAGEVAGDVVLRFIRLDRWPSPSMYPTIEEGDRFVTSRISSRLERGELIVFDYPLDQSKSYVKRVVGISGDTIEVRKGQLILNRKPASMRPTGEPCSMGAIQCTVWSETLDEKTYRISLVNDGYRALNTGRDFGPTVIPNGQVFVIGDNRDNSADSRYWGNVPIGLVRGKPKFIYWSSGASGVHWNRINQPLD